MIIKLWRWLSGADALARLEAKAKQAKQDALEEVFREAFREYREELMRLSTESMTEVIDREVNSRLVQYYNGGYQAGLHEGWTAAKNRQVFPAVDGPARAEARRIFESRPEGHPPMTQAELAAELKARLGAVSGKTLERVWKTVRLEHPEKTKGPGAPKGRRKNTAPDSRINTPPGR